MVSGSAPTGNSMWMSQSHPLSVKAYLELVGEDAAQLIVHPHCRWLLTEVQPRPACMGAFANKDCPEQMLTYSGLLNQVQGLALQHTSYFRLCKLIIILKSVSDPVRAPHFENMRQPSMWVSALGPGPSNDSLTMLQSDGCNVLQLPGLPEHTACLA